MFITWHIIADGYAHTIARTAHTRHAHPAHAHFRALKTRQNSIQHTEIKQFNIKKKVKKGINYRVNSRTKTANSQQNG